MMYTASGNGHVDVKVLPRESSDSSFMRRYESTWFFFVTGTAAYVVLLFHAAIFRSTPRSRPNKVGLKCPSARPYVRTSVRPQNISSISVKFGMLVEVDE